MGTACLAAAGATFDDVVKRTFLVTDIAHLSAVRTARDEVIDTQRPPASSAVQVAATVPPRTAGGDRGVRDRGPASRRGRPAARVAETGAAGVMRGKRQAAASSRPLRVRRWKISSKVVRAPAGST
nr:Rid family hydrolase [Streptomyces sp. A3M-1-3]